MSPSKRSDDKVALGIYIPEELKYQLQKKARLLDVDLTSLVVSILIDHTKDIELTASDYHRIAERIENKKRRTS